jgi:subtilisin family serine protease
VVEPRFRDQWSLDNRGQTGGTPGADIDAATAWGLTKGKPSVVVAVLDSGIDLDHPDLASRLWRNPGEIPGNGRDDEGNGRVDDVHGWDFISGDATPQDGTGHGTSVAGIIAAADNGIGIIGVAPGVTIMPLRVCTSVCPLSAIVAALSYAAASGADIVNMSFTGEGGDFSPIADVLTGDGAGMLAVVSSGNAGVDIDKAPRYPASFPLSNIVAVAASDHYDQLAGFSNYGNVTVDLAAPGSAVLSSERGGGYRSGSGTSFAAPHVAGVAALAASARPGSTPQEIASLLAAGVERVPGMGAPTRWNGRLDAGRSVALAALGFTDTVTSVFRHDIAWLARTRIAKGCNPPANDRFCPESEVTRGQFAAMMRRALDLPAGPDVFRDDAGSVFGADINALAAAGIAKGCNPPATDRFCPDQRVSRGEMASFLTRAFDLPRTTPRFTDAADSVHATSIGALAAAGITKGCGTRPDRFCPDDPVTRGQMAAFLRRADG